MKQILIPASGLGSRVREHYGIIKPLIEVNGKTLIEWVIQNVYCKDAYYIFIVQREHCREFELDNKLNEYCKKLNSKCSVVQIDGQTSGAASSCLKAKDLIDNNEKLLIANADQYCKNFSTDIIFKQMEIDKADVSAIVFEDDSPKWSFMKVNNFGQVCRVAEKNPISNLATLGYYFWMRGKNFVKGALDMISDDFRVNGEYYVCPVISYNLFDSLIVKAYYSDKCYGTGTIIDIENFREISKTW